MKRLSMFCALSLLLMIVFALSASGQITPSDDSYTLTSTPTTNYGTKNTLLVESAGATTFVRFDLSSIPPSVTGSMVAKATMKIYIGTVTTAGSFNVDLVTSPWTESTITASDTPTLGGAIASAVAVAKANKNDYVLVDVTTAVVEWLNGTANDGIALVPDGTVSFALNSKETTTTSHPAELDIVYASGSGTITGVTTASGSGLTGGGTSGTLSLSLTNACAANQILQWSGSAWACATAKGTGTITGVTAGTDLTGGGTSGNVTLNLDTTKVPQLTSNNVFSGSQTFSGNAGVGVAASTNGYTPLTVGTANSFGTWFAIANSSSGGHTWNIISAGSGNAEGAGNIGITDLTGKSTIFLEGNANVSGTLNAANVSVSGTLQSASVGGSTVDADISGTNTGSPTPGLQFGGTTSGETIASNRVAGINRYGLDFYTNSKSRMSILNYGLVGIGTTHPVYQLEVDSSSNGYGAIFAQGGAAASGSGQNGSDGIDAYGNSGDGAGEGGAGGLFSGGGAGASGLTGEGIIVFGGTEECIGPTCFFANYAGDFEGSVYVKDGIYQPSSSMYIDHPLDPANKYLFHSSVESSDMKNIYDGNVTTDASGQAVVELPEWFEALNRDFRYQLTTIGQPAQAWIASKIANHAFTIKTDKPNVEISWQVTGIRQDAWANSHRIPVETQKSAREAGHYLHPELFGAPEDASISWARHPETMKRMKEMREKQNSSQTPTIAKSRPTAPITR